MGIALISFPLPSALQLVNKLIACFCCVFGNSSSYRDLLGTAETIIDMNQRMHLGEGHLAGMGKACNSGLLEKKAVNMSFLVAAIGATGIVHCWEH